MPHEDEEVLVGRIEKLQVDLVKKQEALAAARQATQDLQGEFDFLKKEVAALWQKFRSGSFPDGEYTITRDCDHPGHYGHLRYGPIVVADIHNGFAVEIAQELIGRANEHGRIKAALASECSNSRALKVEKERLRSDLLRDRECLDAQYARLVQADKAKREADHTAEHALRYIKILKRQLEGEKRFAGDLNEQTAKQAQEILRLRTERDEARQEFENERQDRAVLREEARTQLEHWWASYNELRDAIRVLEPDMDHDHHTLKALPEQVRRYINEYLFPKLEKLNSKVTTVMFEPLTFEDWLEHAGRFDPDK